MKVDGRLCRVVILRICVLNNNGPEFEAHRVSNLITSSDEVYVMLFEWSPGVDFLIVKKSRFAIRQTFLHEFMAKKLGIGEQRNGIELSL